MVLVGVLVGVLGLELGLVLVLGTAHAAVAAMTLPPFLVSGVLALLLTAAMAWLWPSRGRGLVPGIFGGFGNLWDRESEIRLSCVLGEW